MSREAANALRKAKAVVASARDEGRTLTSSEYELINAMTSMAESHEVENEIKAMGERIGAPAQNQVSSQWVGGNGPGDVFVASQGFKSIQDASTRPQTWSTGIVEVSSVPLELKGTLTQTTGGGPGGGLIPPHYEPGVVSKLFEPVRVRDILGQSQTTASQVRYVVEGTATSGAAGVPEGGTKPESILAYSEVVEPVRKIATALPISDEMLDDAPLIPALQRAGIGHMQGGKWDNEGVAFHSFRRACGSLLVNAGMDLTQVQQRLRHAQLATTLACYVEEVDSGRSAADTMGGLLWGNRGDTDHPQTTTDEMVTDSAESALQSLSADTRNLSN